MKQRISIDTRTIQPGDIFIPVGDGSKYCDEAIKKGASVLDISLTEYAIQQRQNYQGTVIGITGSFGKTTLKDTLTAGLSSFGVSATEKNYNNEIGVPLTIANADLHHDYWIIEMGIRKPGDMAHLSSIVQPDIAILSGFGYTHMEFYSQDIELLKEKLNIISNKTTTLFIPSNIYCKQDIFSLAKSVDIIECPVDRLIDTNHIIVKYVANFLNLNQKMIEESMDQLERSPHRLNPILLSNNCIILDDSYNSNPTAVQFSVEFCIENYQNKRILIVLGDMEELGSASESLHKSTYQWVTSQKNIQSVITYGKRFLVSSLNFTDHSSLSHYINTHMHNFDVILIKGSRSNQLEKVINHIQTLIAE